MMPRTTCRAIGTWMVLVRIPVKPAALPFDELVIIHVNV